MAQFEISQREKTANSSRPVRSKTGNDEGKESKSNRSIKISVFTILNLLLLRTRVGFSILFLCLLVAELQVPCEFTKDTILISAIAWDLGCRLT